MGLKSKDLLGMKQLTPEEIMEILEITGFADILTIR